MVLVYGNEKVMRACYCTENISAVHICVVLSEEKSEMHSKKIAKKVYRSAEWELWTETNFKLKCTKIVSI